MEKLTAKEILDIIEDNMSVEQFAYCDYPISDSFEESQEVKELRESSEKKWNEIENHPTHEKSWSERDADAEYQKLRNEYDNIPRYYNVHEENWLKHLGLGKVVEIEQYGGEDQGSTWYSIKHFVDHDIYIQTDGYYSSYHGTDFDEGYGYEVKPVQVMVTQYKGV